MLKSYETVLKTTGQSMLALSIVHAAGSDIRAARQTPEEHVRKLPDNLS